ncbi:MAG: T9SS type A sorting domain-containing protein [Flavobacterium sp. JAD_PAG50586_2]|nr:MAG: T9SS type A sorting domain-containing protein [Flavobacterium sp. JAD_PAG50586_2]
MKHYYNSSKMNQVSVWKSLFIMALLLGCQNILAQLTIPAGNTYTSTSNRPLGAFYGYDRTLSVYNSSQMNITSGTMITGIRYYCQIASTTVNLPVFVYLKNVSLSSYSAGFYNATAVLGSTLVYSGTLPAADFQAGKWVTIPFTTPFEYTGTNLQILVGTNYEESNADGPATKAFRWSDTSQNQTQYWNSNIAATFPSNGTVIASKPNIQILYNTPGDVGTISLDYTTDTMLENRTKTFAVNRSGGSTGTVSVDYATSNGTAIAGTDYNATSGTLTWADGDMTPKMISITTLADFIQDNAETINITLSNPVGTTFVGPTASVVTVTDVLPPMNGTYTVGTGGNYPSLTNTGGIFQAINNRVDGVSGPITINIISDLTGETGSNGLNEIAGGHAVLIQPFGGARTITGALGTTSNLGLIRFDGTDNVTINGSLVGAEVASCQIGGDATLRQLTIVNNSIGTTAAVLFTSSTTGAYNNTIKNVNLVGASPSVGYGAMFRVFPHSNSIPSLVNNQNSRVVNCSVKKASIGIYSSGSTTSNPNTNLVVTGNDISTTGADRVSRSAIIIFNETNPQVTFNKVNIQNTTSDLSETVGLAIGASQAYATSVTSGGISGALVANNWITGVVSTVDLGGSTAGIAISGTAFGTPNIVKNNMISNVSGLSQFTYHVAGIWVVGAVASETKLYHNTISLYGDRGSRTNQSPSYGIAISGLDPSVEMRNNIISTTQIATGGGFVKTYAFGTLSMTFANLVSDNNVFYSAGAQDGGFRSGSLSNNAGTSYATLADWTAATSRDSNSIEVAPVFVAPNDLHLLVGSNPIIEATPGIPIASVTTDIDCNPRSTTNPAIGAQEINVSGYSISAAAGTGGTITPAGTTSVAVGGNQSYNITANCGFVVSDVLVDGVSQGTITTYTFTGVTASHTITAIFTAQTATITAAGPTSFCVGGSVVLTSSAATGNVWSTGETTQSITAQASGNYWVSVNNGTCNSPISAPITITITAPPTAPTITSGSLTFCQGGSVTLTSSALTGNLWSNGATTRAITVSTSGSYSVLYNNGGCNSAPSAITTVTVNPLPVTPTISASGSTTLCTGGNVVLTSSSATGNTWSTGATTQSITVSATGNYTVRVNNGTCTSAVSEVTTVTVNTIPARPTITVTGATSFCEGGSTILTSSATTGNLWSNGETTQAITVTTSGIYTVTSTVNGCTSTTSAGRLINVNPTPVLLVTNPAPVCAPVAVDITLPQVTAGSTGGGTLTYWTNASATAALLNPNAIIVSGTYYIKSSVGTCSDIEPVIVTINAAPTTPTINANGLTTFCTGGSVVLTSSAATGNIWSSGATTQAITVSSAGNYSVAVTTNGCSSASSDDTVVTVNPIPSSPTISVSGATTFCTGGSVILTSSSATGNVWSTGATTESITVSSSGNYSVAVTASGCTSGASTDTVVTVNPIPSSPTISVSGATTFCTGGSVTLNSSSATGNVWSNGATTQAITVSAGGNYSVTVTNSGCSSSASADTIVTVNDIPATPTITEESATTFCSGGSVILTSSSATGNVWSTGATTQSITVSSAGNYSVAVTTNGCSSSDSTVTTVSVNPAPNNEITQNQGIITATQAGATYQWFICPNTLIDGATSQTYTPLVVGDYEVVVTLGTCTATSDCITVTELGTKDFDIRNFRLYPNPVTNMLIVEYTNEMSEVSVFNMIGQKVLSSNVNANSTQIDMSRLPSATYLVKVSSENVMKSFKVIKE